MFMGGLNHTGARSNGPANDAVKLWGFNTRSSPSISSPAVAGGRLYVGSADNNLYCLNATNGALLWNFTTGASIPSSPAIASGKVYFGSNDHNIYCLDGISGDLVWSYSTSSFISSSPAVAAGCVFIEGDKKLYCVNATSGIPLWNYTFTATSLQCESSPCGYDFLSSPAISNGCVYVGSNFFDDNKTFCFNASSGALLWSFPTGGPTYSSPAIAGGRVYFGSSDYKIYCVDATTGSFLWSYTTGNEVRASPAVTDGRLFCTSRDGYLYCLDALMGSMHWRYEVGISTSSPALAGGFVYAIGSTWPAYDLYCLDATTGAFIWRYSAEHAGSGSSPAIAGSNIYFCAGVEIYCLATNPLPTMTADVVILITLCIIMLAIVVKCRKQPAQVLAVGFLLFSISLMFFAVINEFVFSIGFVDLLYPGAAGEINFLGVSYEHQMWWPLISASIGCVFSVLIFIALKYKNLRKNNKSSIESPVIPERKLDEYHYFALGATSFFEGFMSIFTAYFMFKAGSYVLMPYQGMAMEGYLASIVITIVSIALGVFFLMKSKKTRLTSCDGKLTNTTPFSA